MPPQQPFQSGPRPQFPQQPQQPNIQPQAPSYGYGETPHFQPSSQPQLQQHPSGQYEVVPPPQSNPNNGHAGHNPYEFIVSPESTKKPGASIGIGGLTGGNFILKMSILIGGVIMLFIIAGVIISALAPKGSTPGLVSIAERQQEIIRVSTAATQLTQTQDGQNFVANVEASVTSSQNNILAYLKTGGTKIGTKQLALDQDPQTDTQLAAAASANNYDDAVAQQLSQQLQTYDLLLQTTFSQTSNTTVKQMVQGDYNGSQLLIKQAKNLENELNN